MPAYSFKERFVPFVLDGSKSQTVRSRRKHPAKVGDKCYLYFGLRTKWCRKLREETCTDTRTIMITKAGNVLIFSTRLATIPKSKRKLYANPFKMLNEAEADRFAWVDGFRPDGSSLANPAGCFDIMYRWFSATHQLPFIGDIIYWKS